MPGRLYPFIGTEYVCPIPSDNRGCFADILYLVQDLLHGVLLLVLLGNVPLQEIGRRVVLLLDSQAHQRVDLAGDELLMLEDLQEYFAHRLEFCRRRLDHADNGKRRFHKRT